MRAGLDRGRSRESQPGLVKERCARPRATPRRRLRIGPPLLRAIARRSGSDAPRRGLMSARQPGQPRARASECQSTIPLPRTRIELACVRPPRSRTPRRLDGFPQKMCQCCLFMRSARWFEVLQRSLRRNGRENRSGVPVRARSLQGKCSEVTAPAWFERRLRYPSP